MPLFLHNPAGLTGSTLAERFVSASFDTSNRFYSTFLGNILGSADVTPSIHAVRYHTLLPLLPAVAPRPPFLRSYMCTCCHVPTQRYSPRYSTGHACRSASPTTLATSPTMEPSRTPSASSRSAATTFLIVVGIFLSTSHIVVQLQEPDGQRLTHAYRADDHTIGTFIVFICQPLSYWMPLLRIHSLAPTACHAPAVARTGPAAIFGIGRQAVMWWHLHRPCQPPPPVRFSDHIYL